jgi:hypothetical protein
MCSTRTPAWSSAWSGWLGSFFCAYYGHLVTVAGELAGELAQADVIAVRT